MEKIKYNLYIKHNNKLFGHFYITNNEFLKINKKNILYGKYFIAKIENNI